MNAPTREALIGRLVQSKENPGEILIVADVVYDVKAGEYAAFLRKVSPRPPQPSTPLPLSSLKGLGTDKLPWKANPLAHLAARALASAVRSDGAAFANRTIFKAYQFRPLVKYLKSGSNRILIADEVGLGKTIEAGYILVEEAARSRLQRVLILCPAALRTKWRQELWRRFGIHMDVVDGGGLRGLLESEDPFSAIASFDSLRNASALRIGKELDMLIVDEVHHMIGRSGETMRRTTGIHLSKHSARVVALSATPIQLEVDDLRRVLEVVRGESIDEGRFAQEAESAKKINQFLLRLRAGSASRRDADQLFAVLSGTPLFAEEGRRMGALRTLIEQYLELSPKDRSEMLPEACLAVEDFNPLNGQMIRNRRTEVGEFRARDVKNHRVELSNREAAGQQGGREVVASELSLYREVDALLTRSFSHVHRQQLSSCLPAMIGLLRSGMEGFSVWRRDGETVGPLQLLDVDRPDLYELRKTDLTSEERSACLLLADKYGLVGADTKWDELSKILGEVRDSPTPRKAVVFTQWKPTLEYLMERASHIEGLRSFSLSGEISDWKRERTLQQFVGWEGNAVLFATDFLSEGVDLQCADTVVNYDFPYNPQRIEQRIGRVDRVGQASDKIHVHNIWIKSSLDEKVVGVVAERLNMFEKALGDVTDVIAVKARGAEVSLEVSPNWRGAAVKEIAEFGVFSGAEDFLDKGIDEFKDRKAGGFGSLLWLILASALEAGTGGICQRAVESDSSVRLGPVSESDLELVRRWAGVKNAAPVLSELESSKDGEGHLLVAKVPAAQGLFLTPSHPLAGIAIDASLNSFEELGKPRGPVVLRQAGAERGGQVVFCKYSLENGKTVRNELAFWTGSEASGFSRADGREAGAIRESLLKAELEDMTGRLPWTPGDGLIHAVQADYGNWSGQQVGNQDEERVSRALAEAGKDDWENHQAEFIGVVLREKVDRLRKSDVGIAGKPHLARKR